MATIHDVMPAFELFQPTSIDDTLSLLERHRRSVWVLAGGLDTFDWLKDRNKRPSVVIDSAEWKPARHQALPDGGSRWRNDHADRNCEPLTGKRIQVLALGCVVASRDSQSGHSRRQVPGHPCGYIGAAGPDTVRRHIAMPPADVNQTRACPLRRDRASQ